MNIILMMLLTYNFHSWAQVQGHETVKEKRLKAKIYQLSSLYQEMAAHSKEDAKAKFASKLIEENQKNITKTLKVSQMLRLDQNLSNEFKASSFFQKLILEKKISFNTQVGIIKKIDRSPASMQLIEHMHFSRKK